MSAFHLVVGCAVVICGIWGFADIVRYLKGGRTATGSKGGRPKPYVLFFRSVVPFITGILLIANAQDSHLGGWILNVTAGVLLTWLITEELGSWLRARQQARARASRG